MATRITASRIQALGIPIERISARGVAAKGVGSLDSDYSEAGPVPGVPEPDRTTAMVLQASGSQSDDGSLTVLSLRAGDSGPSAKAGGYGYRDDAAAETNYMGWDGYEAVTGVDALFTGNAAAGGSLPTVVRLQNRRVVVCHEAAGTVLSPSVAVLGYDPATEDWTTLAASLSVQGSMNDQTCPCLVEIPEDGLLLLFLVNADGRNLIMVASDDGGATWTAGNSYHVLQEDLPVSSTINEVRAAYSNGEMVLFIQWTPGGGGSEIAQYASVDRGVRFDQVAEAWGVAGDAPNALSVTALAAGGFLLTYADGDAVAADTRYKTRRIGSAWEDVQNATAITVTVDRVTPGRPSVAVWTDEDGVLYLVCALSTGTETFTAIFRSMDSGDTWEPWGGPVATLIPGATTAELNEFAATSTGGLGLLITRYTVPTSNDSNSALMCVYLGGFGTQTLPATDEAIGGTPVVTTNFPDTQYICWSESDDNSKPGGFWTSIELPDSLGWTATGAGGTGTITADLELQIATVANTRGYRRQHTDSTVTTLIAEVEVQVNSGGSLSTKDIAAEFVLSDYDGTPASATFTYALSIRIAGTGWRLYDDNAGAQVGSTVVLGMGERIKIRIVIDNDGNVLTFYAKHGPQRTAWTAGPASTTLTNTPADVPNEIEFGNLAAATATSEWIHAGYCFWGWRWAPPSNAAATLAAGFSNSGDLHGRMYSALPVLVHDGVRIAAVDGPTLGGDSWTITPEHTYSLDNIFPLISPSPRRVWRSAADSVEEYVVWRLDADFTESRLRNTSLLFLVLNSNLETVVFERWNGAAWTTIVTLDSTTDWTGLTYDRRGGMLIPRTGQGTVALRYFWYGAHEGDTFEIVEGGSTTLHRIARNSEGAWNDTATVKRPTIKLERDNLPGALTDQEFGTGKIRRKDFGAVVHSENSNDFAIRMRIPAQATADGYYQIGQLLVCHLAAFAHEYDNGRSITREFDAEMFRRRGGTRRAVTRGPSRRVVEIAWADTAVDASRVQADSPEPDYVGGQDAVDLAIGTPHDVLQLVEGVLMEGEGPVRPVVYLPRVPTDTDASHALVDWRDFVYGRMEVDPRVDGVTGDESRSELNRLNTITIREEV